MIIKKILLGKSASGQATIEFTFIIVICFLNNKMFAPEEDCLEHSKRCA